MTRPPAPSAAQSHRDGGDANDRIGRLHAYPPTLVGVRLADDQTIGALAVETGGAGFVLADDEDGHPIVVRMFGPEPVDYAVIGDLRLRQVLALRALALGAHVVVRTNRPETWAPFIRVAAGRRGDIRCVAEITELPSGRASRPVLVLLDAESSLGSNPVQGGPWSVVISASDQATRWNADDLTRVDAVFATAMSVPSARTIESALGIRNASRTLLAMEDEQLAVISDGSVRTAQLRMSDAERWITGARTSPIDPGPVDSGR